MADRSRRVLVSGYAQAPRGTCLTTRADTAGVVLEIDSATDTIVDAEFMMTTELGRRFCREQVVGYSLANGIEPLIQELSRSLLIPSQSAFVRALRSAAQRYWERTGRRAEIPPTGTSG